MTAVRSRSYPPAYVKAVLSEILANASPHDAFAAALSVTHRGLAAGFSPPAIREFLHDSDPERFAAVASTPPRFKPVLVKATARREALASPAGREALVDAMAVALVGYLFSPPPAKTTVPRVVREKRTVVNPDGTRSSTSLLIEKKALTNAQLVTARRVFAGAGVDVIRSMHQRGFDSALVNQRDLAMRLGCSPATVRSALKTGGEADWLSLRSKRHGGSARYGIRGIATPDPGQELRVRLPDGIDTAAWDLVATLNALAELREGVDPVADLILLADHPAWGHAPKPHPDAPAGSCRDGKVWLTALAIEAGVDPCTLGLTRRAAKLGREAWTRINLDHGMETPLRTILDADAIATGADVRAAEAQVKRQAEIADRRASIQRSRERREKGEAAVGQLLARHPVPAQDDATSLAAWEAEMTAVVSSAVSSVPARRALAKALSKALTGKSYRYDAELASAVAGRIAGC